MKRPTSIAARTSNSQYRNTNRLLDPDLMFPSHIQPELRHLYRLTGTRKLTSLSIVLRRTRWSRVPHCGQKGICLLPVFVDFFE